MNLAVTSVNIFCIFILLIIGYAQYRHKERSRSEKLFDWCIIICLVDLVSAVFLYVASYYHVNLMYRGLYKFFVALSFSGIFIFLATLYDYYASISDVKRALYVRTLRVCRIVLYSFATLIFIITVADQLKLDPVNMSVEGSAQLIYSIALVLSSLVAALTFVIIWRHVDKSFLRAFLGSMVLMMAVSIVIINFPNANFLFASFTLTLLILYVIVQTGQIKLSQIETTQNALEQVKESNVLLEKSYRELEEHHRNIDAVANMYSTMHYIDLVDKTYKEIICGNHIRELVEGGAEDRTIQERLWSTMVAISGRAYKDKAIEFVNLDTLEERLKGRKYILTEIENYKGTRWKFLFVRVGKTTDSLSAVIYASQILED